ncbi:MAG TPA: amidohydrolase family protein [Candidatus Binataceae bacterium]|jgi:predicted TIM-barrel fold metal-dependent hydrolase|nr:amidohydrolase family protein [Candidatus Binataceae bacterium]
MEPIVSADDHVVENPDVWTRRMSRSRWGIRIPHIEHQPDGSDCWMVDGNRVALLGSGSVGALMPDRTGEPRRWEEIPPQVWAASERLAAMDRDGIDFSVLYPSVAGVAGETFGRLSDPELELACVRAYNDYLIEEWAAASPRFVPQCLIPLAPIDHAVAEIRRSADRGHKGIIIPAVPDRLREGAPHINDPAYDPIWSVCEELELPVCFHAGSLPQLEMAPYTGLSPRLAEAMRAITRPAGSTSIISNLIVSRILERHPKLKVVFAESTVGLVPYILEVADYAFVQRGLKRQFDYEATLSDLFRRNCYAVSWYDNASLRQTCAYVGANNVLWGSSFPHATSTWPDSRAFVGRCTEGLSHADRRRVLWANAAELYKLEMKR